MKFSVARNLKEYEDPNTKKTFPETQECVILLNLLLTEMANENLSLKIEIAKLKKGLASKKPSEIDGILYWVADEFGEQKGPVCHSCYDPAERLVRVQYVGGNTGWRCLRCANEYDARRSR